MTLASINSALGLFVLNQTIPPDALISDGRGIYYSRLFKKPSTHSWFQINRLDNIGDSNFGPLEIDIRLRTGSGLPYNYSLGRYYTFDEFNALIKNTTPDNIDGIMWRWQLGRSLLGINGQTTTVNGDLMATDGVFEVGTAFNTTRLPNEKDPVWNYWSLPNLSKKSYIVNNSSHDYIQIRVDLRNFDPDALPKISPEIFKITLSSFLIQSKI